MSTFLADPLCHLNVAVSVGNGTGAQLSTLITFFFWKILIFWFCSKIDTMSRIKHAKEYEFWMKNKKVMAQIVLSATGQPRDIGKCTHFLSFYFVSPLSWTSQNSYFSVRQYCWGLFAGFTGGLEDNLNSWARFSWKMCCRQRDVGNGTCFLLPFFFIFNTFICF